mgnify:CR=1 FL=1
MIDKIAVPFWLCWTAGMLIGLETGDNARWLLIGAVVGIAIGLALGTLALRRKRRAFQATGVAALQSRQAPAAPPSEPEQKRAA